MRSTILPQLRPLSTALRRWPSRLYPRVRYSSNTATYSTPLAKHLAQAIKANGPISLSMYMRQCLTSESGGYYTTAREGWDPFGQRGDFITSPEISQMFGEMIGIWIVTEWMAQGKKDNVQLVELGPGRGTLMDDVLRTIRSFPHLSSAISNIYLIEASPSLRTAQRTLLCGPSSTFTPTENGKTCVSKYTTPITWYSDLRFVPYTPTTTPFILAHEFFDALPIHAFTSTRNFWRELLVSHNPPSTTHRSLHTPRSQVLTGAPVPEFSLVTAKGPTPYSKILPTLSPRYEALKKYANATIEISPDSLTLMESIARRIGKSRSGAALVIDYGPASMIPVNSLRGIKAHRSVSPFSEPGEVDISADVDFTALAERAVEASDKVEVHGPVEQSAFLGMLGIKERMEVLVKGLEKGESGVEEKRKSVESGYRRLVERSGGAMGKVYKAMAVIPESGGRKPVGFGGGVAE